MAIIDVDIDKLRDISKKIHVLSILSEDDDLVTVSSAKMAVDCNCKTCLKIINETLEYSSGETVDAIKKINVNLTKLITSTSELMQSTSDIISIIADNYDNADIASKLR